MRSGRSRCASPAASSSTDSTSFSLAGQWAPASSCSLLLALLSSSAGSCCDCWFTGEFLSLPWYLFLLDVFYLDSRGVIVVARWECARGLASGLQPVSGSLAGVFFPLFVIRFCRFLLCTWIFQVAGSLVVLRRVKLAEQPPGSLVVCASKHKVRVVLLHLGLY